MNNKEIVSLLQRNELFKLLPDDKLVEVANTVKVMNIDPNQVLFLEGDKGDGLYIISSGMVNIVGHDDKIIAQLKENNFFGELALIDNAPRSASAITKTACTLLFIDKETFNQLMVNMPSVLRAATTVIIRYLREQMRSPLEIE